MSVKADPVPQDEAGPAESLDSQQSEQKPQTIHGLDDVEPSDVCSIAQRRPRLSQLLVYGLLPGLALLLTLGAGYLKWQDSSARDSDVARIESVRAAKDSTVALLS